ncbi:hypothetical protein AALO_G00282420 [Alosa alosa]|uniref:Uncharacterized protein n=1 Tax=Alosa alosa TaxID=278164 RepID=A0AAV6FJP8_9TELE|nr:hypothetical protein AALO_G00282420 [Alosa alosa]
MARQTIESFPAIPEEFHIDPDRDNIAQLRRQMADEMILASESKEDFRSHCGLEVPLSLNSFKQYYLDPM